MFLVMAVSVAFAILYYKLHNVCIYTYIDCIYIGLGTLVVYTHRIISFTTILVQKKK